MEMSRLTIPGRAARRARPVAAVAAEAAPPAAEGAGIRQSSGRHRNDIQGLRAVAVLIVALNHAGLSALPGGYVGVDVFFVLSGYLITRLLITGVAKQGASSLGGFYLRRARRILPAATVVLIATDIAAYHMLNFVRAKEVLQDSMFASIFGANFRFASIGTNYFARAQPPSPLQHFWSLAVEEQFYLVWPAILAVVLAGVVIGRRRRRARKPRRDAPVELTTGRLGRLLVVITLISAGSLAYSIIDTPVHPAAAYFSTFARAWELGLGAMLAVGADHVRRLPGWLRGAVGWLGLAAIGYAAVRFTTSTTFPGSAALLPTVGAALVIAAGIGTRPKLGCGRILSLPPFTYIGDRSYSFYLWHWPFLILVYEHDGHTLSLRENLLLLLAAFLVSMVSFRLVENPIRRLKLRTPGYAFALWPASILVVVILAGTLVGKINLHETVLADAGTPNYPGVTTQAAGAGASGQAASAAAEALEFATPTVGVSIRPVIAAVAAVQRHAKIPTVLTPPIANLLNANYVTPGGCEANQGQALSKICHMGDRSSKRLLILLGDSHAMMWMPALLNTARADGWDVVPLTKTACTPGDWFLTRFAVPECTAWLSWAERQVARMHPDVTLVGGDFGDLAGDDDATTKGVAGLVNRLKASSKQVVVLGDQPKQSSQPVDCLLASGATMSACSTSPTDQQLAIAGDVATGAAAAGGKYIDTSGWFCYQVGSVSAVDWLAGERL
jgi:peptidoglycan/LPS O-acetylase OafA/YrhL